MSAGGFQASSKSFLRDLSRASEWMLRRNVDALCHWWRPISLRGINPDEDGLRPPLDETIARQVFAELQARNLLTQMAVSPDGHPEPAFLMRCDPDGWEKGVADGRWLYGQCRKIKKTWALMLCSLILGGVLTGAKDEIGSWVKAGIEKVTGKPGAQKSLEKDKMPQGRRKLASHQTHNGAACAISGRPIDVA